MGVCASDNIGTQTVGGRAELPGVPRSGQYKYSSAVRNAQQVIAVPAPVTRPQVPQNFGFHLIMENFHAFFILLKNALQVPGPVLEPSVFIQGQEPLTASMLAAAPLMDQKQLLGAVGFLSAVPVRCLITRL